MDQLYYIDFIFAFLCSFHSTKSSMIIINLQFIQIFFSSFFPLLFFIQIFFFLIYLCEMRDSLYFFFGRCWWCFIFHVILFWIGKKLNIFIVNRLTGDFYSSFKSAPFFHTQYTYFMCYIKYRMGSEVKKHLQLKFLFYFGRLNWVRRFLVLFIDGAEVGKGSKVCWWSD